MSNIEDDDVPNPELSDDDNSDISEKELNDESEDEDNDIIEDEILDGSDNNSDEEEDEEEEEEDEEKDQEKKNKSILSKIPGEDKTILIQNYDDEIDTDEDEDEHEDEFQKFDVEVRKKFLETYHPETHIKNYKEVIALTKIKRQKGIIYDPNHKTVPILSKFEKARILGIRAKQLDDGAPAFISVPTNIIDGYSIAEMELENKKIPFIIRRPLPNGESEYWKLKDLL